jgi:TPR repeat protein
MKPNPKFCSNVTGFIQSQIDLNDCIVDYLFAVCLQSGFGIPKDQDKSFQFYQKASKFHYF